MIRAKRTAGLLALLLAGACAAPVQHFGSPATEWTRASGASFIMAADVPAEAREAARAAAAAMGMHETPDGRYLFELGFASGPPGLELAAVPGTDKSAAVIMPKVRSGAPFCRARAWVLNVALVDRTTGQVALRGGATITRCRATSAEMLPLLVEAALPSRGAAVTASAGGR
jgi:hypothetical protein